MFKKFEKFKVNDRFETYTRRCKRCDNFYETKIKGSEICPDCRKPNRGEQLNARKFARV